MKLKAEIPTEILKTFFEMASWASDDVEFKITEKGISFLQVTPCKTEMIESTIYPFSCYKYTLDEDFNMCLYLPPLVNALNMISQDNSVDLNIDKFGIKLSSKHLTHTQGLSEERPPTTDSPPDEFKADFKCTARYLLDLLRRIHLEVFTFKNYTAEGGALYIELTSEKADKRQTLPTTTLKTNLKSTENTPAKSSFKTEPLYRFVKKLPIWADIIIHLGENYPLLLEIPINEIVVKYYCAPHTTGEDKNDRKK